MAIDANDLAAAGKCLVHVKDDVLLEEITSELGAAAMSHQSDNVEALATKALAWVSRDPSQGSRWELLGECLQLTDKEELVYEAFQKAVELDPKTTYKATFYLAQAVEGESALRLYRYCKSQLEYLMREVYPDSQELRLKAADVCVAIAELYMTDLCFADDAEEQCLASMREAEGLAPDYPPVLVQRCSYLTVTNQIEEACAVARGLYERYVKQHRALHDLAEEKVVEEQVVLDFEAQLNFCRIMTDIGMVAEAIELLVLLREVDEDDDRLWHRLAIAYMLAESYELALEAVEEAMVVLEERGGEEESPGEGEVSMKQELEDLKTEITAKLQIK